MQCLIIDELLTIQGNGDNNGIGHCGIRGGDIHVSVSEVQDFLLNSTVSDSHIAHTFLVETFTIESREGTSSEGAFIWCN